MSDFVYRRIESDKDYDLANSWIVDHGGHAMPNRMFSTCGFIVSKEGIDVCCGFLYQTDGAFALIEWVMWNKKAPKKFLPGGIRLLFQVIEAAGRSFARPYELFMTLAAVDQPSYKKMLEKHLGFIMDKTYSLMIKK